MSGQRDRISDFRRLLDAADHGLAVTDPKRLLYVNESFAAVHGFEASEELIDREWRTIYPESTCELIDREAYSNLAVDERWTEIVTLPHADDSRSSVRLMISRMDDERFAWETHDVSEFERTRDQLRRYESILTNIRDAVYTLDTVGRITWVNEVAIEAFDGSFDRDDLIGAPVSKVMRDDDIQRCVELIQGLMTNSHDSARCEVDLLDEDGRAVPVELHLTLLSSNDGSFRGTIGVARDISDRKRREQRLSVLNRVLRHNVRNDVNVISGLATDLARETDDPDREKLERIRERGERLVRLSEKARSVEDTLDADADVKPIDLVQLVDDICDDFSLRFPDVSLVRSLPKHAWIAADQSIDTVVSNLVENAIQHNDARSPRVEVAITDDDDLVGLHVSDNGPGIPAEELVVLDNEVETPLRHGSGIGLWLVNWIVDGIGGELRFDRSDSGGTEVTVVLDRVPDPR